MESEKKTKKIQFNRGRPNLNVPNGNYPESLHKDDRTEKTNTKHGRSNGKKVKKSGV